MPLIATVDFSDQTGVKTADHALYLDIAAFDLAKSDKATAPSIEVDDTRDPLTFLRAGELWIKAFCTDSGGHTVQAIKKVGVITAGEHPVDAGLKSAE